MEKKKRLDQCLIDAVKYGAIAQKSANRLNSRFVLLSKVVIPLTKQYQVTRKRQITLPKKLADKKGIRPGDVVIFEESGDAIVLRKSSLSGKKKEDLEDIRRAIRRYSNDIPMIKRAVKLSGQALIENLSRHVSS